MISCAQDVSSPISCDSARTFFKAGAEFTSELARRVKAVAAPMKDLGICMAMTYVPLVAGLAMGTTSMTPEGAAATAGMIALVGAIDGRYTAGFLSLRIAQVAAQVAMMDD